MSQIDVAALRTFLAARAMEDFGRLVQIEPGNEVDARAFAESEVKLWILELPPELVSTEVLLRLAYLYENHEDFDTDWEIEEPRRPLDWTAIDPD